MRAASLFAAGFSDDGSPIAIDNAIIVDVEAKAART